MSEDKPKTPPPPCPFCGSDMAKGTTRCTACGTFRGWRHLLAFVVPAASSVLALLLAGPPLYESYLELIAVERSDVHIFDAFFENETLITEVTNFTEYPASVNGYLECVEIDQTDHPIKLTIYPASFDESRYGDNVFLPQSDMEPTNLVWGVWNAQVKDARPIELTAETILELEDALWEHLREVDDFSTEEEIYALIETTLPSLGQGAFLPMQSSSTYHARLSARLLQTGARAPLPEYEFGCSLSGKDASGAFETAPFRLSFGPSFYGITAANPFE